MTIGWHFNNTYSKLSEDFREEINPIPVNSPELVILNEKLASELNLNFSKIDKKNFQKFFQEIHCLLEVILLHKHMLAISLVILQCWEMVEQY